MRYTEEPDKESIGDIFDLIRFLVVSVFLAPYRLINEISKKVMYLNREPIEKLVTTSIFISLGFLLWDFVWFIVTGKINLIDGFIPVSAKFIVIVFIVLTSMYMLEQFDKSTRTYIYIEERITLQSSTEELSPVVTEETNNIETVSVGEVFNKAEQIIENSPILSSGAENDELNFDFNLDSLKGESPVSDEEIVRDNLDSPLSFFKDIDPDELITSIEESDSYLNLRGGSRPRLDRDRLIALLSEDSNREGLV